MYIGILFDMENYEYVTVVFGSKAEVEAELLDYMTEWGHDDGNLKDDESFEDLYHAGEVYSVSYDIRPLESWTNKWILTPKTPDSEKVKEVQWI